MMTTTINKRCAAQDPLPALNSSRRGPGRSEIPDAERAGANTRRQSSCDEEAQKAAQSRTSTHSAWEPLCTQAGLQPSQLHRQRGEAPAPLPPLHAAQSQPSEDAAIPPGAVAVQPVLGPVVPVPPDARQRQTHRRPRWAPPALGAGPVAASAPSASTSAG